MVTSLPPSTFALVPGRVAYALINKYRCDAGDLSTARSIEVSLPGGASGGVEPEQIAPLDAPEMPSESIPETPQGVRSSVDE